MVRRLLVTLGAAGAAAAAVRARKGSVSSAQGGAWRELSGPDLR